MLEKSTVIDSQFVSLDSPSYCLRFTEMISAVLLEVLNWTFLF